MSRRKRLAENQHQDGSLLHLHIRLHKGARAARRDPNAFAQFCFVDASGKPLCQGRVHRELQAFLQQHRHALIEMPRDHGKSLQACIRALWELGREPGLRIKIVCASEALAAERCRFLRDAIMHNLCVRAVFPHLLPGCPWSQTRFTLSRPTHGLGPSVAAFGVGALSTGSRADLLLCDDIVDVKALRSRADRERVKAYFHENLLNLLEPDGRFWGLFTPWHTDDLNSELKKNGSFPVFSRPVGENLEPVWPEKWSRERLEERRREIGSLSFSRAYRLVCVPSEEVPIQAGWIRFWTEQADHDLVVLVVDPAVSQRSTADFSALVTLARTTGNEVHCLEAVGRRVSTPDLMELIEDANQRHRPEVILFESNAAFAGIRDLMIRHARFGPKIKTVVQTRDKVSRVHALSVPVENGAFRPRGLDPLHVHPSQQALFDEMTLFPFAEHDDLLDAAATGTSHLLERPSPRIW